MKELHLHLLRLHPRLNPNVLKWSLWSGLWEFVLGRIAPGAFHPQPGLAITTLSESYIFNLFPPLGVLALQALLGVDF